VVTIRTGRDDPRAWVRAAYAILDAVGLCGKLPSHAQIAATSGVSRFTIGRAARPLRPASKGVVPGRQGGAHHDHPRGRSQPATPATITMIITRFVLNGRSGLASVAR
jgi:hypothetical protein